jgi:hypothetical protein
MTTKQITAFRGTAVAFFGAGLVFFLNDNTTLGLCFFAIALAFLARSTKQGGSLAQERPVIFALVLAGLIVLTVIIAAVMLLPKFL